MTAVRGGRRDCEGWREWEEKRMLCMGGGMNGRMEEGDGERGRWKACVEGGDGWMA